MAYLLLWLSTVWGLGVASKVFDGAVHGSYTYDFHQFISLLSIGFTALHLVVLLFDPYLTFSIPELLVPFLSSYRQIWTAMGVISFYIILLVTITFYIRDRIGMKTFRTIHVLSLAGFLGAALHGLFTGTDSNLPVTQWMYAVTSLSVVFFTTYWLAIQVMKKQAKMARSIMNAKKV